MQLKNVIGGRTRLLCVLGYPVEHSLSPAMHNAAIEAMGIDFVYVPFRVDPGRLAAAFEGMRALGIRGANCTIPHKEEALRLCDVADPNARRVGAVNTVRNDDGVLAGFNTDGDGFAAPLQALGFAFEGSAAVVLGAGGAARSVAMKLADLGARVTLANRSMGRARTLEEEIRRETPGALPVTTIPMQETGSALREASLLVNATSVGMAPAQDGECPVDPGDLHPGLTVYDLVYRPLETRLLAAARKAGCQVVDGLGMLAAQGAKALEIWTGQPAPTSVMEAAARDAIKFPAR